jgi:hypothetical protein
MKWLLIPLATLVLAGCAVVPAPYPYAAVPESNFGRPVYRRGYSYPYYDAYGRPYYYRRHHYYGPRYFPGH